MISLGFKRALPWTASVALASAVAIGPAAARENISPAYDGAYAGTAEVMPALSKDSCKAIDKLTAEIKNGFLLGRSANGDRFHAIVTKAGFVTGKYRFKGAGKSVTFEGNAGATSLTAGLVSPDAACVWVVHLGKS